MYTTQSYRNYLGYGKKFKWKKMEQIQETENVEYDDVEKQAREKLKDGKLVKLPRDM